MADKLKDILEKVGSQAVATSASQQSRIGPQQSPVVMQPRGFASPQDVYDQDVGYETPFNHLSPGTMRGMWQVPDVALTHTPVNTLQSAGTPNSTQQAATAGGLVSNPSSPAAGWNTVPNMQLQVTTNGPVHVIANLSVQSNVSSDVVSFALYRDGQQVGQSFTHTTSNAANSPSLVGVAMIDNPATAKSFLTPHLYSLYWKAGSGLLTASKTQRSMYSVNLTPH